MSRGQLQLPPGWQRTHLEELADIVSGVAKGRRFNGVETVLAPYLRVANVQAGHLDLSEVKEIEVLPSEVDKYRLEPGDVLMTEGGDRDKLGRGTIWRGEVENCIHQNHIFRVRPDRAGLLPDYLGHYLGTPEAKAYFLRAAKRTTGIASINLTQLSEFPVALPPVEEQHRIATILDKAATIRQKRRASIGLADRLIQACFFEMFGDPVTNKRAWPKIELGRLGKVTTGNTPSRKHPEYYGSEVEWIKSDNINTHYHILTKASEGLSSEGVKEGRVVPAGSILVTCIAGSPECIGNLALADRAVAFNQQINAITPYDGVDPYFLYALILTSKKLVQGGSSDSMKGMVSKSKFETIKVIDVGKELQREFGRRFRKLLDHSVKLDQAVRMADLLFDSIAQKAFRGEL